MSSHAEKVIARFLRQEQCSKQVVKYQLRHAGKGSKGHDVESFEITEAIELEQLDTLAHMILDRAQLDADGFGPTQQRYTLTSYLADEHTSGRIVFRLKGAADLDLDDEEEAGEEAPSMRGLTQQLMRHNEFNNRNFAGSIGTMMNLMVRRMESQDRTIEKMMEERVKGFEVIEAAKSEAAFRDIARLEEEGKQKRMDMLVSKSAMLLPVILDHFTGGKIPSKSDPMSLMVAELVGSMSIEQINQIRGSLSPEQGIVLFKVLQKFQEQKQLSNGPEKQDVENKSNGVVKEN